MTLAATGDSRRLKRSASHMDSLSPGQSLLATPPVQFALEKQRRLANTVTSLPRHSSLPMPPHNVDTAVDMPSPFGLVEPLNFSSQHPSLLTAASATADASLDALQLGLDSGLGGSLATVRSYSICIQNVESDLRLK